MSIETEVIRLFLLAHEYNADTDGLSSEKQDEHTLKAQDIYHLYWDLTDGMNMADLTGFTLMVMVGLIEQLKRLLVESDIPPKVAARVEQTVKGLLLSICLDIANTKMYIVPKN